MCYAQKEYIVSQRVDGGYDVKIVMTKRHWSPITAEGPFPKVVMEYSINFIGKGKDWSYRNQIGYFYSKNDIHNMPEDVGYAWVDIKREYIYLNFFEVSSPDKLIPSPINGKYSLKQKKK